MSKDSTIEERARATKNDPRWMSIINRDASGDGKFYYSVKTTGVYCRPSGAARLARPENVLYHLTCEDAEKAGFRPCKRCKPNQPAATKQNAKQIAKTCRLIEQSEETPSLDELAEHAGLSVYHFHRTFKAITGLTPKEYAEANRSNRVRASLEKSETVTEAIYDAGFNSSGRFYETSNAVLGMTPSTFRAGGADTDIFFAIGECSLGSILVAQSSKGVCSILLGDRKRTRLRRPRGEGGRPHRRTRNRIRPAPRHSRNRISAARVEGASANPARLHGLLFRYRQ